MSVHLQFIYEMIDRNRLIFQYELSIFSTYSNRLINGCQKKETNFA